MSLQTPAKTIIDSWALIPDRLLRIYDGRFVQHGTENNLTDCFDPRDVYFVLFFLYFCISSGGEAE